MIDTSLPVKTFRGTLAEVLAHQNEIPADALVEVNVYRSPPAETEPSLAESLSGLLDEAEHLQCGEPVRYASDVKKSIVESVSRKLHKQGFSK